MSYMRLFIELRKEESNAPCGQVRVELQDQPGRVDCKVRSSLMGLPAGQLYDMALVCERGGRYKEYPLGQFAANPRGQAGPMFRGSFESEPGQIPVTEFKAVVARGQGSGRLMGFRFEPMLIPWRYEEAVAEPELDAEPEVVDEPEPEINSEPEVMEEAKALPESAVTQEPVILQEPMEEYEPPEVSPAAAESIEEEPIAAAFAPTAIFVMRDLSQVDLVCGDAGKRAFQRYRHLILAQQDKENYLGIPCRFRPTHKVELAEEGYMFFYTPHGNEPGYGEFGYWMKRL